MNYSEESLKKHKETMGKLNVTSAFPVESIDDLSIAYTPGVAEPCRAIAEDVTLAYELTIKGRSVAVVTDGSAVLGLGNIGPEAALPVMEGKALLFKRFGNLDGYPICLATQDVEEIIQTVKNISPGFGAINLEDISAPRCFEIERRLVEELDIPVMHDDQHGTAVVVLAGLMNALKVVGKSMNDITVTITGSGAGGLGIANLLLAAGVTHMKIVDSRGMIAVGRERMNTYKDEMAARINPDAIEGSLADAMTGADVFVGVSKADLLDEETVRLMNKDAIVFALSNPVPEVMPDVAKKAGVKIVGTGRSDFPNQVNNSLVFPGMFKGALMHGLKKFTDKERLAAARALAGMVSEPTADKIIPGPFEEGIADTIAAAMKR